ncbi:MAG: flavodoxin FldA, partial [Bacteroidetes bacterium HGW-Bacteroidetes-15]
MKTAIVYSHKAVKTTQAAKMIKKELGIDHIDDLDIESISPEKLKDFNLLILGVP